MSQSNRQSILFDTGDENVTISAIENFLTLILKDMILGAGPMAEPLHSFLPNTRETGDKGLFTGMEDAFK